MKLQLSADNGANWDDYQIEGYSRYSEPVGAKYVVTMLEVDNPEPRPPVTLDVGSKYSRNLLARVINDKGEPIPTTPLRCVTYFNNTSDTRFVLDGRAVKQL